jgi:hypothetical protein
MKQLYKVVNIDCKLGDGTSSGHSGDDQVERALSKINYRPLLTRWPQERHDRLFAVTDEYNRRLEDHYWEMAGQAHRISPCGELQFEHAWCVGPDGLRADLEHGIVYVGHSVDWGMDYFRWWLENSGVGFERWEGPLSFVADFGDSQIQQDDVVMMKGPGYDIYGHWLLDYVPQLTLAHYMDLRQGETLVFDSIKPWMKTLLGATGIADTIAYRSRLSEHRNLRMPTGLKNGYALAQPINMIAWNNLRAHFNHHAVRNTAPTPEKIYISRKNWGGQRPLPDAEAVEKLMSELGFTLFYPEQHEIAEQARIFANARYVVGEDGSALHSLIFTRPGARLGVLMHADRMNLWHAGICDAMGHRIGYCQIGHEPSNAAANLNQIRVFAANLLSH